VIAFDRVKQRLEIVSIVFTEEAGGSHERLRELYDAAVARTREFEQRIFEPDARPANEQPRYNDSPKFTLQSNWPRRVFEERVRRASRHQSVTLHVFPPRWRGNCHRRVTRNARALSRPTTRLSSHRRHAET